MKISFWAEARKSFHAALFESVLVTDKNNVPSFADKHSPIRGKRLRDISDLPFDLVI